MKDHFTTAGKWIWMEEKIQPDSFAAFRRKFTLPDAGKKIKIALAADSQFVLYVNGQVISGSQFSDYPSDKTYTVFDLTGLVAPGENTVAVLVHFWGDDFLTSRKGYPGLWAVIFDENGVIEASSKKWKVVPAPGFYAGKEIKFTIQLGYSTTFDAREEGAVSWMEKDFDDSGWQNAADVTARFERTLRERPLPVLTDLPYGESHLLQQGFVVRHGQKETPSEQMFSDYLRETLFVQTVDEKLLDLYSETFEVFSTLKPCIFKPDVVE